MLKVFDFVLLMVALIMAQIWSDGNVAHMWILTFVVGATNIVGFFRGAQASAIGR